MGEIKIEDGIELKEEGVKFERKSGGSSPPEALKTEIFDPSSLVADLQKDGVKDVFLIDENTESLVYVVDWIPMPDDFKYVMACPGIPCGHVMQVYGKKDSGKTTFATLALIEAQRDGGIAVLIDTEHKFNLKRAEHMGLDIRKLIIFQVETLEVAFAKFNDVVKVVNSKPEYKKRKVLIVWDSIGQTPSEAEMDTKVTDFAMTAAKIIKGEFRKKRSLISREKIALLLINQVYANMNQFGKKTTPYGGSGPEYASSIMLEFAKKGRIRPKGLKSPEPFAGTKIEVSCEKNHVGQPFRVKEMCIDWRGFVLEKEVEYAPEE